MRASGRLWTIKPWFSRGFARLLTPCWILPEVFGREEMVGRGRFGLFLQCWYA
jgi:hypothetical protein